MARGWIGVDLDGTLALYDGWKGPEHIGEPVTDMVFRVKNWLSIGQYDVKIFTARVSSDGTAVRDNDANLARLAIWAWCEKHIGQRLEITNQKDYAMIELWDDRCVQVEENTGRPIGRSTRGLH